MKEIDFIESMKVLKLEQGDLIVFKTDKYMPGDHVQDLKSYLKSFFKENFKELDNKIIILTDGMDIGVLRK